MDEARGREAWGHTSSLLAMLANLHRDPKKTRPYKPADFHPYLRRSPRVAEKVGVGILKSIFVDSSLSPESAS